jgi:hypothetical protein
MEIPPTYTSKEWLASQYQILKVLQLHRTKDVPEWQLVYIYPALAVVLSCSPKRSKSYRDSGATMFPSSADQGLVKRTIGKFTTEVVCRSWTIFSRLRERAFWIRDGEVELVSVGP